MFQEPHRELNTEAIAFTLETGKESRKEQLQRWREEKLRKMEQERASKKKPFKVGIAQTREAIIAAAHSRKTVGIPGTASRVRIPLTARNQNVPNEVSEAALKDSRKNLTSVFQSSEVSLSAVTDMLSMKLDFGVATRCRIMKGRHYGPCNESIKTCLHAYIYKSVCVCMYV